MITPEIRSKLVSISGESWVRDTPNELYAYSYDATPMFQSMPEAVVHPANTREVSEILRLADEHRIPVIPRGSGTNLAASTIPVEGGIVLNLNRLNQIHEIDVKNLTATVGPGVITADFHQAVESLGLFYPPDPGSMRISTLGGNVAQCAGGMRGLKYGVTKDYVMGLEYVLPSGEIMRCGGKNVKDVAGYDLTRLLVGSEGTLAVITEITLKLIPLPESKRTLVAYFTTLVDAAKTVENVIASRIIPATMEFMDQGTMQVVDDFAKLGLPLHMKSMLLIEQDGPEELVGRDIARIAEIAALNGAASVEIAATPEEGAKLLTARRAALSALSRLKPTTIMEDATVPRSRLADIVDEVERVAVKYGLQICTFGHAGDGNLHPTCMTDERNPEEIARVELAFEEIFRASISFGGTITGEHGVGLAKMKYLHLKTGEAGIELMQRIKEAFDPHQIMNPGKIFARSERRRLVVKR
ncbi:FAD-linked oxidase C-terminal domain-containing protein [Paenibacillus vini]|uniref:FAD-binding oxidoreductase n=1 Tax=Paenibacillus vini TaxID=1476024 RepID=UPI0025B64B0B|nr:FAD-linked oxidase C-terminal domain-containing protein [Paenibacillus vini]MDN4069083.1 FAD-linked oxidase C-terminal domain-containing protein [Paenibacillus vini]